MWIMQQIPYQPVFIYFCHLRLIDSYMQVPRSPLQTQRDSAHLIMENAK